MKSASFFILSMALHASALVYPVSFYVPNPVQLIEVTMLPMEQESHGTGAQGAIGNAASPAGSKSATRKPPVIQPVIKLNPTGDPEPRAAPAEATAKFSEGSAALVSATANSADTNDAISGTTHKEPRGDGASGVAISGNGLGSSGLGAERGNGQISSGNGAVLTQARYSETPKPIYPESARSEGREGRVLLRVLVDDQGRTKAIEINSSSGSEALDRAAAEAIKRWRFHPARYGDKTVESWLRIPIEFRLADAKSW
jgi:periplasmic protein TonB